MTVILLTPVAFLLLALTGANGEVAPADPTDENVSEASQPQLQAVPQPAPNSQQTPQMEYDSLPTVASYEREQLMPQPQPSPGLFGLKTFLLGLVVFAGLLQLAIEIDHVLFHGDRSEKERTEETAETLRTLAEHLYRPFKLHQGLTVAYAGSIAVMLSGLYGLIASIGRKIMHRMGIDVSRFPPTRGNYLAIAGFLMLAVSLFGVFVLQHPSSFGLSFAAHGILGAGMLLLIVSFIQKQRYARRLQ